MIPCLSKTLFGVECLGCGFQRAFLLLLQGEFAAAFKTYPALYMSLLLLGIVGLHFLDKSINYKKLFWVMAIINFIFMVVGYWYKHF